MEKQCPKAVFPPDQRTGDLIVTKSGDSIAVIVLIDMSKAGSHDHALLIHHIMQASEEYGLFLVMLHVNGVIKVD